MSKDPAFLFYYKDFDNDTADWEADAVGWYIRLLIFQAGNGYIPSNIEEIAQIARVRFSEYQIFSERWAKRLAIKFKTLNEGKLYNLKLSKVQAERKSGAIKKSVLAVFGNYIKSTKLTLSEEKHLKNEFHKNKTFYEILDPDVRKNKILEYIDFIITQLKTLNAKRTQQEDVNANEDVIINTNTTEVLIYPTFDDFWDLYDKKTGSIKKLKPKFEKLPQETKDKIMAYIPDYKLSQPDKKFRKNPETFLNNESWNDEIILQSNGNQAEHRTNAEIAAEAFNSDTAKQFKFG